MTSLRFEGAGFDPFTAMLERFGFNVQNAAPAFEKMADHQAGVWRGAFRSEGASMKEGPWDPLNPDYGGWKARHFPGRGILELTGELKDSLTQRPFSVEVINDHQMIIGTAVEYASYHQDGKGNNPVRKMVGDPRREDIKVFAKILHRHVFETDPI
ncbi:hypothetical protein GCM10027403_12990 [Arthrobacter tecti]